MTTEHKLYWGVGILSALIFVGSFFTPGEPVSKADLPWNIEHPAPGMTRVFGLTLGVSTANEAEQHFREEAKTSLFKSPQGVLAVEAFFEQVDLAGLKAKIVIGIAVPDTELHDMYERGVRMSGIESGKKITLAPEDVARVRALPIASLTYMPSVRLDEEMIAKRFGQPAQRIRETKSGVVHWLYPQNGLDITLSIESKPVLQYVPSVEFDKLLQPLLASGEVLS
jgi:hypothetical protein